MKQAKVIKYFSIVKDPRVDRTKKHHLIDVLVISVCGIICGCKNWVEIEEFGNYKIDLFKKSLQLSNGVPSHDTFARVFGLLDSKNLQECFYNWARDQFQCEGPDVIAIDGKSLNASHGASKINSKSLFGMVSAWSTKCGISLGQVRSDFEKKHEKVAMSELLDVLFLKEAIVTIDAGGCCAKIANKITDKGGDYFLALKKNQKSLLNQAIELLEDKSDESIDSYSSEVEKNHGRIEKRTSVAVNVGASFLDGLLKKTDQKNNIAWKKVKSVCKIMSERIIGDKTETMVRYYISSLPANAKQMLDLSRNHWEIENKLHWTLDVVFDEDRCRSRKGFSGENFALLRHIALNLLKKEVSTKKSMPVKMLRCGWDNDYLWKVLRGVI